MKKHLDNSLNRAMMEENKSSYSSITANQADTDSWNLYSSKRGNQWTEIPFRSVKIQQS